MREQLTLTLHPEKLFLKTLASGVDFLGWVHFPDYRVLRTATKRRMWRTLEVKADRAVVASYSGMLGQGNAQKLAASILRARSV